MTSLLRGCGLANCLLVAWVGLVSDVHSQTELEYNQARIVAVHNTLVSSEAPGIIRTIEIEAGDEIRDQAALVTLNSETFQADYEVALAEEEIAKLQAANHAKVEYAQKSAEVSEKTLAKSLAANRQFAKTIPVTELEKLQLQLDQARLSGEQAIMELDAARWTVKLRERMTHAARVKLDSRTVRAPFQGTIAQLLVQPGQWVNAGEPIARVIDLERLRVEGYFRQDLVGRIQVGSTGSFAYTLEGKTKQVPVKVSFVSPEIVEGIFQVRADIDNRDRAHMPGVQGKLTLDMPLQTSDK